MVIHKILRNRGILNDHNIHNHSDLEVESKQNRRITSIMSEKA